MSKPNVPVLSNLEDTSDYDIGKGVNFDIGKGATNITISNPLLSKPNFKHTHSIKSITKYNNRTTKINYDCPKRLVTAYIHSIINPNKTFIHPPIYQLILSYYFINYKVYGLFHHSNVNSKTKNTFHELKSVENKIKSIENIYSLNNQYIIKSHNQMYNLNFHPNKNKNKTNLYVTHFEQTPNIQLVASSSNDYSNQTFIKFQNESIYSTEKVYSYSNSNGSQINIFNKHLYKLSSLYFNNIKENIIDIKCGRQHSLFLTLSGNIYSMGNNDKGQCGLGSLMINTFITQPTLINKPFINKNIKIKSISCDENSSCCIDKTNKYLWCWGDVKSYSNNINNNNGFLSIPNIYILDIINNQNINVQKVKCNNNTTIVIDENGNCYILGEMMCGKNIKLNTKLKFKNFDICRELLLLVTDQNEIYKLTNKNGVYNICKLNNKLFPNLKDKYNVHSVVVAVDSTIIVFH